MFIKIVFFIFCQKFCDTTQIDSKLLDTKISMSSNSLGAIMLHWFFGVLLNKSV